MSATGSVWNPYARFRVECRPDQAEVVHVDAPVRGRGRLRRSLRRDEGGALVEFLLQTSNARTGGEPLPSPPTDLSPDLEKLGLFLGAHELPGPPPVFAARPVDAGSFSEHLTPIQRDFRVLEDGIVPEGCLEKIALPLAKGAHLWVRDDRCGVWLPYQPNPVVLNRIRALAPGDRIDARRDPELARVLRSVALLGNRRVVLNSSWWEQASALHAARGHVALPALLPRAWLEALRGYFRTLAAHGWGDLRAEGPDRRFNWHNDPMARLVHVQLTSLVERLVGAAVQPSYCYVSEYQPGAALPQHVDRRQCEYTVSLAVGYDPSPSIPALWSLNVVDPDHGDRVASYPSRPGDAVLLRGCRLPHFRDRLTDGYFATSALFHYVPIDFAESLD